MANAQSFEEKISLIVAQKPSQSAVDFVINAIKELLVDGHLRPGDRIPSETELTKLLSVSRGSIREAMKILSVLGVVRIKRGDGTYIAESGEGVAIDSIFFSFVLTQPSLKEIYDLRMLIEAGVMDMAIGNATEEDIVQLQDCQEKMVVAAGHGRAKADDTARLDLTFHEILGRLTGNRLIQRIYSYIMNYLSQSVYESHRRQGEYAQKAIDSHAMMLDVIKKREIARVPEVTKFAVDTWRTLIETDAQRGT
jgi:DNA-binding FadR family transcriptional regulator